MISVLIPTYNQSVIPLVEALHKQLKASKTTYEIIVWDDGSTDTFHLQNQTITQVGHIYYFRSEDNLGSTATRRLLYKKSLYDWLLYVDADVMPKSDQFVQTYLDLIPKDYDAIYGGSAYAQVRPPDTMLLRWAYGNAKECIDAGIRNQIPYKNINSANFLIKRSVFSTINPDLEGSGYGFDLYFGALLKAHQIKVHHINNEVYHLGIESSERFLEKTRAAIDNLLHLYQEGKMKVHDNSLLHAFTRLKALGLCSMFSFYFKRNRKAMELNLLGKNPSISLFQRYKLFYMCFKYKNR